MTKVGSFFDTGEWFWSITWPSLSRSLAMLETRKVAFYSLIRANHTTMSFCTTQNLLSLLRSYQYHNTTIRTIDFHELIFHQKRYQSVPYCLVDKLLMHFYEIFFQSIKFSNFEKISFCNATQKNNLKIICRMLFDCFQGMALVTRRY